MTDGREKAADEMFCRSCGAIIKKEAELCPKCGVRQRSAPMASDISSNWLATLLLCLFLGSLGVHRFYVGKVGTGILMLVTLGGCGVWTLIDLILIITDKFTDAQGQFVKRV